MDVMVRFDFLHDGAKSRPVVLPPDGFERLRIGGLNADFKLEQLRPDSTEKIQCFRVNNSAVISK